jgi:hypothetical protein
VLFRSQRVIEDLQEEFKHQLEHNENTNNK